MSKINHFRTSFERAIARSKDKKETQHVQQAKTVGSDVINKAGNSFATSLKTTTAKLLSDEQYRTSIIAKAIACINKHKGVL